jgi:DtxR family Mn-dependent transcriptional regulator
VSVSSRIEDYMETIFAIEISGREATVTDLANTLGVAKATVVAAVRRLVAASLATHKRYGTLALTDTGRARALDIYRRHEHLTFLFHDVLGFDSERAMSIACAMEHELDEKAEGRILGFVDYLVKARREGRPWVQDLLSVMGDERKLPRPLSMIPVGDRGLITRVTAGGALRHRLLEMGFVPGTVVCHSGIAPLGDPLLITVRGTEVALRKIEAISVWICPVEDEIRTAEYNEKKREG